MDTKIVVIQIMIYYYTYDISSIITQQNFVEREFNILRSLLK